MALSHWACGAEEDQGRSDRPEQGHAEQGAGEGAAASGDRRAAHDHRRDDLQLEADSRRWVDVGELDDGEERGQARQRPHDDEHAEDHPRAAGCPPAARPRGPSRSRRPPGPPRGSAGPRRKRRRRRAPTATIGQLARLLPEPEPLEPRRQVLHELALGGPAQRLAADHQRGQGHHDRRQAEPGDEHAVDRPQRRARRDRAQAAPAASAAPPWPAGPATTPQMLNCEPIEMSIWRRGSPASSPPRPPAPGRCRPGGRAGWPGGRTPGRATARSASRAAIGRGHRQLAPVPGRQ